MSGKDESATPTVASKHAELLAGLDRQAASLALPPLRADAVSEATGLLAITRAELRGLSAEGCAEAAILLQQLAFHVQRRYNRCQTVADWAEANIRHVIAGDVAKVAGWSYDERRPLAVTRSVGATKLAGLRARAQAEAADLIYLAARIEAQARLFETYARLKGKQHG